MKNLEKDFIQRTSSQIETKSFSQLLPIIFCMPLILYDNITVIHILSIVFHIFSANDNLKECFKHFHRLDPLLKSFQICSHLLVQERSTVTIFISHHDNVICTRINILRTSTKACGAKIVNKNFRSFVFSTLLSRSKRCCFGPYFSSMVLIWSYTQSSYHQLRKYP